MKDEFFISKITQPIGKTKIVLLTLPTGGWEKFNALHAAYQEKVPGITHDMIVSAVMVKMLDEQPQPKSTVEAEREKLEENNPS